MNVNKKIVLITGGASGIGYGMALEFALLGAQVVVWDVNKAALNGLAVPPGLSITGMVCNVADRQDVYRQARVVTQTIGPVDILVNNAGVVSGATMLKTPDEKIERTININVLALFWTTKAFLPTMLERNTGHIVTISSAAGLIGVKGLADYSASKFAAFGFDESLRMELRSLKSKVRTTVVCPFFIDTGMFAGVKTKVPLLLPILKKDYVVHRVVQAVLKGRRRLVMPRFAYSTLLLRLLPPAALDVIADFFGINHSMDEFVGRKS
jgi:all-trans-retinol dehydrogenase (NAD+)